MPFWSGRCHMSGRRRGFGLQARVAGSKRCRSVFLLSIGGWSVWLTPPAPHTSSWCAVGRRPLAEGRGCTGERSPVDPQGVGRSSSPSLPRPLRRRSTQLRLQAPVADSVRGVVPDSSRDSVLAVPDRLQVQPLVADPQAVAPRAADEHHAACIGVAKQLGQVVDPARITDERRRALLRRDRAPNKILVQRQWLPFVRSIIRPGVSRINSSCGELPLARRRVKAVFMAVDTV